MFNIYVFMQFFNQHNCRRVDNELDVWHQSVLRNPWFMGVQLLTLAGQLVIIFKGGEAFDTVPLTGAQWGWSLLFGLLTIPLGALLRQVPDHYVLALFRLLTCVFFALTKLLRPPLAWLLSRLASRLRKRNKPSAERQEMENMAPQTTARTLPYPGSAQASTRGEGYDESRRDCAASSSATEASEKTESKIELQAMIDAAKIGRSTGLDKLELHSETPKNDPILGTRSDLSLPPSQDPGLQRLMPRNDEGGGWRRRRGGAAWVEPSRVEQQRRNGLSVEGLLRSKRR